MACSKWLHHRIWCGGLPLFRLPSTEEASREQSMSLACFSTPEFFELRMQIRLKLTEIPSIAIARPAGMSEPFTDILPLMEQYIPYLLALERISRRTVCFPFKLPAPLFHGIDNMNHASQTLTLNEWIAVEKVLTWFAIAQLRAVRAEWRSERGLQRQDARLLRRAEEEWSACQRFASLSGAAATSTKECDDLPVSGASNPNSNESPVDPLLKYVASIACALGHQCALRQLSAHAVRNLLTVEQPERIVRIVSALARRAVQIAQSAVLALAEFRQARDNDLLQQLIVCIDIDVIRWKAAFYHCEQNAFRLDANPELGLLFVELQLALRLPSTPTYPRHNIAIFNRIMQEIQLFHTSQLTQALDDKKELLRLCQQRFGPLWTPPDLDKFKKLGMDNCFEQSSTTNLPVWELLLQCALSDTELVDTSNMEETVGNNIEKAMNNPGSAINPSLANNDDQARVDVAFSSRASDMARVLSNEHRSSTGAIGSNERRSLVNLPPRPSSAQPVSTVSTTAQNDSQPWVTVHHGGKMLHFEKSLPLPSAAGENPQNDLMAQPNQNQNGTYRLERLNLMKRPSSSPSYLSPAKTKEPPGAALQRFEQLRAAALTPVGHSRMWTPTRFPCALCEQRFMRCNLPGVAVMKRIFDIRQKWGVVLHDAKKFSAPSALYAKANVCVMCQEILQCEENISAADATDGINSSNSSVCESGMSTTFTATGSTPNKADDIGILICNAITNQWNQQHHETTSGQSVENLHLVDVALRKRARQSSTACSSMHARNAVQPNSTRCAHTKEERQPWWEVDLANYVVVHSVKIYLRVETNQLNSSTGAGPSSPLRRQRPGVFPLHIAISMKSGVGRDLDDVLASCVSSHKIEEKDAASVGAGTMLAVWNAPPNARGRFVRVQSERLALLNIEHVHVFVAQVPISLSSLADATAKANSDARRRKLKRAAFRASVIATNVSGGNSSGFGGDASSKGTSTSAQATQSGDSLLLSSLLDRPEQAEKKRLSKLYTRFRSLLEQRSRYDASQEGTESP